MWLIIIGYFELLYCIGGEWFEVRIWIINVFCGVVCGWCCLCLWFCWLWLDVERVIRMLCWRLWSRLLLWWCVWWLCWWLLNCWVGLMFIGRWKFVCGLWVLLLFVFMRKVRKWSRVWCCFVLILCCWRLYVMLCRVCLWRCRLLCLLWLISVVVMMILCVIEWWVSVIILRLLWLICRWRLRLYW